ncbi:MAG: type II secretion system protein GspM [Desulfobacterales bacterium]
MKKILKLLPFTITKREKYAVWIASALIAVVILMQVIIFPLVDKRQQLNRQIEVQTQTLKEMLVLKEDYEGTKKIADSEIGRMAGRSSGFTLFSFLDTLAGQVGLKDRIAYMKPSKTTLENTPYNLSVVETKLQNITMKQLTSYLYRIETSNNLVRVKGLSISKTGKQAGTVDAVLLAETFDTR